MVFTLDEKRQEYLGKEDDQTMEVTWKRAETSKRVLMRICIKRSADVWPTLLAPQWIMRNVGGSS
jgi:hypothetical protein